MSDAIRDHVRKIVLAHAADSAVEATQIEELEAKGHRLVNINQTGADTWEITAFRTREVLASGDGGFNGCTAAIQRLDPDQLWWNIDNIGPETFEEITPTDGVPPSLAMVLEDWVSSSDDEDVALIAGWTLDELEAARQSVF